MLAATLLFALALALYALLALFLLILGCALGVTAVAERPISHVRWRARHARDRWKLACIEHRAHRYRQYRDCVN